MRKAQTDVYQYNELSEEAKEKARDWFLEGCFDDGVWFEHIIEEAVEFAEHIGFNVHGDKIYFSAPDESGSNCGFSASWLASRVDVDPILEDVPPSSPENNRIRFAACAFRALALKNPEAEGGVSGNEQHMSVEIDGDGQPDFYNAFYEALNAFREWIMAQLRNELEYQTSREVIEDNIRANEYEFTEDGKRF